MVRRNAPVAAPAVVAAVALTVAGSGAAGAPGSAPRLLDLRVTSGPRPFAGDRRLLATVSPNGDGFRDRAVVTFRLTSPARVRLDALATTMVRAGRGGGIVVGGSPRT